MSIPRSAFNNKKSSNTSSSVCSKCLTYIITSNPDHDLPECNQETGSERLSSFLQVTQDHTAGSLTSSWRGER